MKTKTVRKIIRKKLDDWVKSKSSGYAHGSVSRALSRQAERENPVDLAIGPVACSQYGNA